MFKFMLCFTRSFCFHLFKCYIFFTNHQGFSWIYLYILVYGGSLPSRTSIYVKKKKKNQRNILLAVIPELMTSTLKAKRERLGNNRGLHYI